MAVTWVGGTALAHNFASTLSHTAPAELLAGDALFAFVFARNTVTAPAGWVRIDSTPAFQRAAGFAQTIQVYRKTTVQNADAGATVTFTQSADSEFGFALEAARGVGGVVVSHATLNATATHQITLPVQTATADGELFLIAASCYRILNFPEVYFPAGFTRWLGFFDDDYKLAGARASFNAGESNSGAIAFGTAQTSPNGLGAVTIRLQGVPPGAIVSAGGPLAQPSVLSRLGAGVLAQARAASALGPVSALARHVIRGTVSDPGPLRAPSAVARAVHRSRMAAASPLAGAMVRAFHDFTAQLEQAGATTYYACNLVDWAMVLRVPISSWQGTLQTAGAAYLQAVIPAVASTGAVIAALSSGAVFVIYRGARLPDGTVIEQEMARSLIESTQFDQGPNRYTCTISGYSDAIAPPTPAYPATDRTLRGVRSISSGAGGVRVRCAVDWFLRPGQIAIAGGAPFVAGYLNYYALTGDSYMDVGERTV